MAAPATLSQILQRLRAHYGRPPAPIASDPFLLILWEQVAYLATDAVRGQAFAALLDSVGDTPAAIAAAPITRLRKVTRLGGAIAAAERAERIRWSAGHVLSEWGGDLRRVLRLPLPEARKALARFPMIGEPGADRILVVTGIARLLPLDSNGLRVVQRLGLAPAARDYRTAYRQAQRALARQLPRAKSGLIEGQALLRVHGQRVCRRSTPRCPECPLRSQCPWPARLPDRGSGRGPARQSR